MCVSKIKEIHARVTEFCSGNEMRTSGRGTDIRGDANTPSPDRGIKKYHNLKQHQKIQAAVENTTFSEMLKNLLIKTIKRLYKIIYIYTPANYKQWSIYYSHENEHQV